ncbi:MAG: DUF2378 family protein [Myxococcales bacterium]|nr:DUF2378 family protein [Myxococcales bacterium]MDD9971997.1 DUF2378 family protein [Myxococcales bacterium]
MTRAEPHLADGFVDVDSWAPLDVPAELAAIPSDATISGMFPAALLAEAQRHGYMLRSARERYLPFKFYPVIEHADLLAESAGLVFPAVPIRKGLRKLGRAAPNALLQSTLGRVVLGAAEHSPVPLLEALANAYGLNLRPGHADLLEHGEGYAVIALREIHYFLDCHHVGTFEGALRRAGTSPQVRVRMLGVGAADLLCTW